MCDKCCAELLNKGFATSYIEEDFKKAWDGKLLTSSKHPSLWGDNTRFPLLNRFIDWLKVRFSRPKMTDSNLE